MSIEVAIEAQVSAFYSMKVSLYMSVDVWTSNTKKQQLIGLVTKEAAIDQITLYMLLIVLLSIRYCYFMHTKVLMFLDCRKSQGAAAVDSIADAVTHARFVGTDPESDEVILMKILYVSITYCVMNLR